MRRVFIADDAPDVRETLAKILEHQGFTIVGTATSEPAAIDWLRRNAAGWDLAVVDLLLHEGSGFNVIRQFKQSPTPGKVLVYSGFITEDVRRQCERLGADAVVSKLDTAGLQQFVSGLAEE
ncbi:MAG TPA: response regulator [Ramlibacter sp.]|jgi:DNA-binding NarL/FixJ family response regulator|nr:response regulator [Ramlibacter sp.]